VYLAKGLKGWPQTTAATSNGLRRAGTDSCPLARNDDNNLTGCKSERRTSLREANTMACAPELRSNLFADRADKNIKVEQ